MAAVRLVNNGFTDFEVKVLDGRHGRRQLVGDFVNLRVDSGAYDAYGLVRAPGGFFMSVKEEQYS